jgi:thiamine pyrophosphokinase
MGVCYIIGAGELYGRPTPEPGDLVIAADGGYDHLLRLGIMPDLIIGDMDSVSSDVSGAEVLRFPKKKDETDMHLAYLVGKEKGYSSFLIYGGTGGRPDHTFANYSLLFLAKSGGDRMTVIDKEYDIFALSSEHAVISGRVGATLSLFAFGGEARGVCLSGVEYPADNVTLEADFALGVSNKIEEERASVSVSDGRLLVMISR